MYSQGWLGAQSSAFLQTEAVWLKTQGPYTTTTDMYCSVGVVEKQGALHYKKRHIL